MKKKWVSKTITIPLIGHYLYIYVGKEGYKKLNNKLAKDNEKLPDGANIECDGLHYLNNIYVENIKDHIVLFHEIGHYYEWLINYINAEKECEFKAHLFGTILTKIVKDVL